MTAQVIELVPAVVRHLRRIDRYRVSPPNARWYRRRADHCLVTLVHSKRAELADAAQEARRAS